MRYATFNDVEKQVYPICLLVPSIRKDEIKKAYFDDFEMSVDDALVITLHYSKDKKKTPMAEMKRYITEELVPIWEDMGCEYIIVADGDYFKALTGAVKVDAHLGYVMDCTFGRWKVVYVPNYRSIFYDPTTVRAKINQGISALIDHAKSIYQAPGADIIKFEAYPNTYQEISDWLDRLIEMDRPLTIDIETFSLKHHTAGIGTISFAWSQHEGIAFAVDYVPSGEVEGLHGKQVRNEKVRVLLRRFFERLTQKAIYHSISFDVYVLIYQLFMTDILDTEGMLNGIEVMLRDWDCTKLITYLATNSCAGNRLSLKDQAQQFAGNYAMEDIKDIRRIPLPQLLQYNLVDGLSTWHVYTKHLPTMVADEQHHIYLELFRPAIIDIIQMQLTGLPMDMPRVKEVKEVLTAVEAAAVDTMRQSAVVQQFTYILREEHVAERNAKLKKKRITLSDQETLDIQFNPNSGPQLQNLLFKMLKLPVISLTDSKQPSTDGDTLTALKSHTTNADVLSFLGSLIDYKAVNKLTTSFIPAFENAALGPDGWHYLFGNFNLGGTLSGRLSSSDPNLQNLPANVVMAISEALLQRFGAALEGYVKKGKLSLGKLVKSCFAAPPGWLFCGLDFSSLEDRISALTSKDPNKLKVYTDGYDGHSLRAHAYFGEEMPDIDPNSVESINSIQDKYGSYRQDSKVPTFLLTYDGTFKGMMEQCGFSKEKAQLIEARYHELYVVSDQWKAAKLDQACKDGYVTVAFGLRVRTPLLKQVIRGTGRTPYEAEAEGRSAGNALGQSWCLLNTRAGVEFNQKVRSSHYRLDIRPCAQIHDAQYFLIRDDIECVMFTNEHLVKAVQWQEHPDIAHDEVKLGGELGIFHPHWANEITLANGASEEDIMKTIAAKIVN